MGNVCKFPNKFPAKSTHRRSGTQQFLRVLHGGPLAGAHVFMTIGLDGTLPLCASASGEKRVQCGYYDGMGQWHGE